MTGNNSKPPKHSVIAAERRRRILNRIRAQGSVSVSDLARELNVGVTTIRQDLNSLDQQGKVIRSHGGAMARGTARPSPPYAQTRSERMEEKSWISEAALSFVPLSGRCFIGPGTTTLQFVKKIAAGRNLRVATNGLEIALHLASAGIATVDFFSGTVRADSLSVDISIPSSDIDDLNWDVCFIGAAAVDVVRGLTTLDKAAMRWERKVLEHSNKRILLCDSSKIGASAYARICPVDIIDVLITDDGIDPDEADQFRAKGVDVIITGPTPTDAHRA